MPSEMRCQVLLIEIVSITEAEYFLVYKTRINLNDERSIIEQAIALIRDSPKSD